MKATPNALAMELLNKRKLDEKTNAETWTKSKKRCEITAGRDYISHETGSATNISARPELPRQSGRAPSEPSETPRRWITPRLGSIPRVALRVPPIAVSPFLLALSVYTKYTPYLSRLLTSHDLSTISSIHTIAWILAAGEYHIFSP